MKKTFDRETPSYRSELAETPYLRAKKEWDDRIGDARVQAKNWRFIALLSSLISILLLVMLWISLSMGQVMVYVAEVTKAGRVVNVAPLTTKYQPNQAQTEYFVTYFIKLIRQLPLDPVVAKKNWLQAYQFLTQRASQQLNDYFTQNNPVNLLGKQTVTVTINDINMVSDQSYHADWTEITYNLSGQIEKQQNYSGMFTTTYHQPTTQQEIYQNPLGIYIIDFHISSQESKP